MSKAAAKPRAKAAPKVKEALPALQPRKVLVNGPQKQVFIIDDAEKLTDLSSVQCVSLMHPKHGKPCRYLHTATDMWEVQRVYQPPSSWLIQHGVQEDGSFYLCTRIDPLFLALPLLEKGRKKTADHEGHFMQLDQLLPKSDFPVALISSSHVSGKVGGASSTHAVCDMRDGWNEPVLRLSDAKLVAWLRRKAERMQQSFKQVPGLKHLYSPAELAESSPPPAPFIQAAKADAASSPAAAADSESTPAPAASVSFPADSSASSPSPDSAAAAASASSSSSAAAASPDAAASASSPSPPALSPSLRQCLAFLSEYLSPAHFLLLLTSYGLGMEDVFERKRAAGKWDTSSSGKVSGDIDTSRPAGQVPVSDTKRKAEKPLSSTAKKLASAAKGTKSLASFFGAAQPKKKDA